jgi:glycogen synthase
MVEPIDRCAIVLSPWLPTRGRPFAGNFVVDFASTIAPIYGNRLTFVRIDDTFRARVPWLIQRAAKGIVKQRAKTMAIAAGSGAVDVPLPVPTDSGWYERMVVAQQLGAGLRPLVDRVRVGGSWPDLHGHVGIISGPMALKMGRECNLFLYEHSSFAIELLEADEKATAIYRKVIDRSAAILPVNARLTRRLQALFPQHAEKIREHPNSVDASRFDWKRRVAPLHRLLYIGNLKPEKGTRRMLEALEAIIAVHPDVSLTLVGDGLDRNWLINHPLRAYLDVRQAVPASQVPELLQDHDVLLHLSEAETFGLTAVEAILSGMPVIVAATDGSETVVRPIEEMAGRIIEQPCRPRSVLAAYQEIRHRPLRLDPIAARRHVMERYDRPAVASRIKVMASEMRRESR